MSSRYLIKGATGTGKTELLLERYRYMINELCIPGDSILVLVSNSMRLQSWKAAASFELTTGLKCFTYTGFIQDEISTYYPLITGACAEIGRKDIKPVFLGYEPSKFLVSRAVQLRRERNGAFSGLVSTSESVAAELIGNLLIASAEGIPLKEIGARLANALGLKDDAKRNLLIEADAIIEAYSTKCFEVGIFDISMCIRLYNEYLLANTDYLEMLKKRIRHVIVDDLNEGTAAQIRFLKQTAKSTDTCVFSLNTGLIINDLKAHIVSFVEEFERNGCEVIDLPAYQKAVAVAIEKHPPTELRSDILQQLGERVCGLIAEDGYKPSEIVILSTYADLVTESVLSVLLKDSGIKLCNISRRGRMSDSPLCRSLLTFAQLCHPDCRLFPSREDLRLMCTLLFKLDPVRCTILARRINNEIPFPKLPDDSWAELTDTLGQANHEKYIYIKQWVDRYRQTETAWTIGEFLYKALIEIFLSEATTNDEALKARKMIDSALKFSPVITKFSKNMVRDFIDMAQNQAAMPENINDAEGRLYEDHVFITTPSAYLSSPLCCKVAVICGLSSNNWLPRVARELSNPYVLNSSWKQDMLYTAELDDVNRRKQMEQMFGAVMKKCSERIVTFESDLSANGFQNDGALVEILQAGMETM